MSRVTTLLQTLADRGITLGVHCGALHYWHPKYSLTQEESGFFQERANEFVLEVMRTIEPPAAFPQYTAPLTFQQEYALEHFGDFYGGASLIHLSGPLDVNALSKCIYALVQRHSSLRTKIRVTARGLQHHTSAPEYCELEVLDLEKFDATSDGINSCYQNLLCKWYDAAAGTFDVKLLRPSESEHILAVFVDHLFSDYYSTSLLYHELWTSYCRLLRQQPEPVTGAPMQYSDYAILQRQTYPSWAGREQVYWNERLTNAVPIQFPGDDSRKIEPQVEIRNVRIPLPLSSSLRDVAQRIGVSISFVVVSLISLAVAAWSGQRKFTLPMTCSSRFERRHLDMIGYMPNFVPLRLELGDRDTFSHLCKRVSEEYLTGITHLSVGKPMDGGRRELINAPFVQWFPTTFTEVVSPPRCRGDLEALGLSIKVFDPGPFNLPSIGRRHKSNFLPGLMLWEEDGCIVGTGVFPIALCPPYRTRRRAPDLLHMATRIVRDMNTNVAAMLT